MDKEGTSKHKKASWVLILTLYACTALLVVITLKFGYELGIAMLKDIGKYGLANALLHIPVGAGFLAVALLIAHYLKRFIDKRFV